MRSGKSDAWSAVVRATADPYMRPAAATSGDAATAVETATAVSAATVTVHLLSSHSTGAPRSQVANGAVNGDTASTSRHTTTNFANDVDGMWLMLTFIVLDGDRYKRRAKMPSRRFLEIA